ncbi:hypothetical protein DSUL_60305 [Desulfovibrionales bacterium]
MRSYLLSAPVGRSYIAYQVNCHTLRDSLGLQSHRRRSKHSTIRWARLSPAFYYILIGLVVGVPYLSIFYGSFNNLKLGSLGCTDVGVVGFSDL